MRSRGITIAVNLLGIAAFCYGIFGDGAVDRTDFRSIGMVAFVGSLMWVLSNRTRRSEDDVYEAGRQAGYDAGFIDGRRVARPVIVPGERLSGAAFAGGAAAKQFSQ